MHDDRDIFDLSDPEHDLTGASRKTALRIALSRREINRRDHAARPSILRRLLLRPGRAAWVR